MAKHFGFSKTEITVIKLIGGQGGTQPFFQTARLASAMTRWKLNYQSYRKIFVKLAENGMITWTDPSERFLDFQLRRVKITTKGRDFIRDLQISYGGDYHFYKTFDPEAAKKDLHYMDQYLATKNVIKAAPAKTGFRSFGAQPA